MNNEDDGLLDPKTVWDTAGSLRRGGLALIPTDTVYGLAASIRQPRAITALYYAKGKGESAPLQLLFPPWIQLVMRYASLTDLSRHFIETVGPGGWTAIVPAKDGWDSPALAGGRTVGIRIPDAPFVHEVVRALGCPLAASSANKHGNPSPRTYEAANKEVGAACAVKIDGGELAGIDSTVIDFASPVPRILREGAIAHEEVARILGLDSIEVLRSVRS